MPVSFLNPWALIIGGTALALPIAIHLLSRPRPRRYSLPTIRFLHAAAIGRGSRDRWSDRLLLAIRTLAITLVAIAFARPVSTAGSAANAQTGDVVRIIILDVSQSMAARDSGGVRAIDRARIEAADALRGPTSLRAAVILAGATPELILPTPSTNLAALREAVGNAMPRSEALDVNAAIDRGTRLLKNTPANAPREIVIVSDFQRSNWSAADLKRVPAGTGIRLMSVSNATPSNNLAITKVSTAGRPRVGRSRSIDVEVLNDSPEDRQANVSLTLGGQAATKQVNLASRSRNTVTLPVMPTQPGWLTGNAKLDDVDDALPQDDIRSIALLVADRAKHLLITRDRSEPSATSSHFVERALNPRAGSGPVITRLDPSDDDLRPINTASLIIVDRPGRLSDTMIAGIVAHLRAGKGLLYIAAEPVDAVNLAALAEAAGDDWEMPIVFDTSARETLSRSIDRWQPHAPGIAAFGESARAVVEPLRFNGGLSTRRIDGKGLADDIQITYDDGSAAIVLSACGTGRVGVVNADLSRSSVIASPFFVPLIAQLADRLQGGIAEPIDPVPSGKPFRIALDTDAVPESLLLRGPGTTGDRGTVDVESNRPIWRFDRAGPAGVYQALDGERVAHAVATGAPAVEAVLSDVMNPTELTAEASGIARVEVSSALGSDDANSLRLSTAAIVAVAVCLVSEAFISSQRRGARETSN